MQVRGGWAMDVGELYAMAGVKPDDLDFVQTYDDYPVITMMQFEDLGFCKKGEGAEFVRQHDLTIDGDFPHNTSGGQLSVGQAGAAGAYLGLVEGFRQVLGTAGPTPGPNASLALASRFGMINYDRGLASGAAILQGLRMIEPIKPPRRKNPLLRTRLPASPPRPRSRTSHGFTRAAAEGRFMLQRCEACGSFAYPAREACPSCLSAGLAFVDAPRRDAARRDDGACAERRLFPRTGALADRPRQDGLRSDDCDPSPCRLRGGRTVRMSFQLDKSGQAVAFAHPEGETPNMADDKQWREMTADPKFRRVLVTNGRSVIGQEAVAALKAAGAKTVFVGVAEPWRPFAGEQLLRGQDGIEIVTLDAADEKSATDLAADIGGKVDILVNTTEYVRPGGLLDRKGTSIARDEIDQAYSASSTSHRRLDPPCGCAAPTASITVPPGSTFSRSMRWRTGLPLALTRPRKPRACRSRTAFAPSSGPAASG